MFTKLFSKAFSAKFRILETLVFKLLASKMHSL